MRRFGPADGVPAAGARPRAIAVLVPLPTINLAVTADTQSGSGGSHGCRSDERACSLIVVRFEPHSFAQDVLDSIKDSIESETDIGRSAVVFEYPCVDPLAQG